MSRPAVRYALWLMLARAAHEHFATLIERLSREHGTPRFAPHITLLGHIAGDETGLAVEARELARRLVPFDVRLTEAGYLDEYHRALFVYVGRSSPLMQARAAAEERFGVIIEPAYMPHLSLLYGDLPAARKEAILDDIGRYFDITATVERLALLAVAGPRPRDWRTVCACALGNHVPPESPA